MSATSSTRALRLAALSVRQAASSSSRAASTYTPRGRFNNTEEVVRPPRPKSPMYFTGKPGYGEAVAGLEKAIERAQDALRKVYVWPIPKELPPIHPPASSWKSFEELNGGNMDMRKQGDYRNLLILLNQLHRLRNISAMTDNHQVSEMIDQALQPFEHSDKVAAAAAAEAARKEAQSSGAGIDKLGRAYAIGRRKTSSARVWLVPAAQHREIMSRSEKEGEVAEAGEAAPESPAAIPKSEILINHLPLTQHFSIPSHREDVLRPLRVTGLLGAYNIFGLVRGGGPTGQSGALSLGIARALAMLHKDSVKVLINDNALYRDPREVERKKTGRDKARKAVSDGEGDKRYVDADSDRKLGSSVKFGHLLLITCMQIMTLA